MGDHRIPHTGRSAGELLGEIGELRKGDMDWRRGRAFSLVYNADDPELDELLHTVGAMFLHENALNPFRYRTLLKMEAEVIEMDASTDHPSAEALYQRLIKRIPTLSLDTVYRTLATLARHGLVHKVETGESQARFEVITVRHHHLICRHCLEMIDFHWPSMDEIALPEELRTWGQIENKNVVAYGVCRKCMK